MLASTRGARVPHPLPCLNRPRVIGPACGPPIQGEIAMQSLKNQRVIVTGGSSGLGLGVVEALVERGAKVMVVARDAQRLAEVEQRLGVVGAVGDVADRALATALLQEFRPTVLVLNAGAKPPMGPLH